MAIKYIIDTEYTRRDASGNTYSVTPITRCSTGTSVLVRLGLGDALHAARAVCNAFHCAWSEIYTTEACDCRIKDVKHTADVWGERACATIRNPIGGNDYSDLMQAFAEA